MADKVCAAGEHFVALFPRAVHGFMSSRLQVLTKPVLIDKACAALEAVKVHLAIMPVQLTE